MKSYFSLAWKLAVAVGLFVLVAVNVDWREVWQRLLSLSPAVILAGICIVSLQAALLAWRWQRIARLEGIEQPLPAYVKAMLVSFFFSQGLPASLGADAFRMWWHVQRGASTAIALRILAFDRIIGVVSLAAVCAVSVSIIARMGAGAAAMPLIVVVCACMLFFLLLVLPTGAGIIGLLARLRDALPARTAPFLDWVMGLLRLFTAGRPADTLFIFGIGSLVHLLTVALGYVLARGIGADVGFAACMAAIGPSLLVSYLPISIAGWGVREASLVVAFGLVGVPAETALLISLGIGFMVLIVSLGGGLLWALSSSPALLRNGSTRSPGARPLAPGPSRAE